MLQELCQLALRQQLVGDPVFDVKPIAWIIELTAAGKLIQGFSGTHQPVPLPPGKKGKPKEVAKKYRIPRQYNPETGGTRTAGAYAYFLVDKSDYVLGCALGTKAKQSPTDEKLVKRHQMFIERVRKAYAATKEIKLQAVLVFLEDVQANGLPVDMPSNAAPGDLFGFIVRPDIEDFVHDLPSVQSYWRELCAGASSSASGDWKCLITGKPMGIPALFPQIKRVPGAQSQSSLVSFNSSAFESYGWKSNANAPVSSEAAQAASTALNRLLDSAYQRQDGEVMQKLNIRLSPDTVACYWAAEATGDGVASNLQAAIQVDPSGKAGELWQSVWRGKKPPFLDPGRFYAVTITGAQGRAIVRDWYETTIGEVQASLAAYFDQLELSPNTFPGKAKSLPPHYGYRVLKECLIASRKADDLPSKHSAELFAAAINSRRLFPSALLSAALERMRAEAGRSDWIDSYRRDARAALIKAILIRNYRIPLTSTMSDQNRQHPSYLLGCLFACVERMQYLALGDQINANVANRYFAAASFAPLLVMDKLLADVVTHYFKKASRKNLEKAKEANDDISELCGRYHAVASNGFPARFSPQEQGLFIIGYHIQRGLYLPKKS